MLPRKHISHLQNSVSFLKSCLPLGVSQTSKAQQITNETHGLILLTTSYSFLKFLFLLFICAYNVWVISSPFPLPLPYPPPPPSPHPHYQAETI
jgi:hypothetical protein